MKILRRAGFRQSAWKNGGGVTHEVCRVPQEGAFRWRLSVAQIDRSGPFSDFSGYSRTMVLLAGHGLSLKSKGRADLRLNLPDEMLQFDGALAVHCELSDGPCTDLNLMVADAAGCVAAHVQLLQAPLTLRVAVGETHVVFVLQGHCELQDASGNREPLSPWDAAILSSDTLVVNRVESSDAAATRIFVARF